MVERDVEAFDEAEAEEAAGDEERRLDQPVQLEIGLDRILVDVEQALADASRRRSANPRARSGNCRPPPPRWPVARLPPRGARERGGPDRFEKSARGGRRPAIVSARRNSAKPCETQQLRVLGAKRDDLVGDRAIVRQARRARLATSRRRKPSRVGRAVRKTAGTARRSSVPA